MQENLFTCTAQTCVIAQDCEATPDAGSIGCILGKQMGHVPSIGQQAEQMDVEAAQTCRVSAGQTPRCSTVSHTQNVTLLPAPHCTRSPFYYTTPQNIKLTHYVQLYPKGQ